MSEIPNWQRHFPFEPHDLVEILRWRAQAQSGQMAFTWLAEGDTQSENLTWGELDERARMVATLLQQQGAVGQPVLLVYPPGPSFQVAFLACLYAGAIAVPIYPPDPKRLGRTLPRFIAIAVDCGANFVLTTRALLSMSEALFEHAPRLRSLGWLASDDLPVALARSWQPQPIAPEQMAFLQYTSGSTGIPKGVMVSHRALLLNCDILTRTFGDIWDSPTVTWLPNYHDMGLVEGLLRPLYAGCHCVGMPPVAFLKRPLRWLEAITRHHAVLSGGPNFAFELCARRAETEPIDHLDLSSWRTAYNGAEPVRAHTLDTFTSVFERVGFRPQTHAPGYGLAEATLIVCCKTPDTMPAYHRIQSSVLQSEHRVVQVPEGEPDSQILVGVGPIALERGLIVDPQTFEPLPPDRVGELWLKSPSLASGYWKREEATQETFEARLAGTGEGPFLRTGDLAFIREDGELFITGRMKDLIIIRGKNHYPQDIETTVADSYPALFRPGCNAAFSVEVEGEERLVVVQEFQRRVAKDDAKWENRRLPNPEVEAFAPRLEESPDIQEALRKIRESVIERHEVEVWAVALIKPGSIFKTSSGKIQRQACKKAFAKGDLEIITLWRAPLAAPPTQAPAQETATHSVQEIRDQLRAALASRVHQHPSSIQDHVPFARYGLDSANAVSIVGELERWLGRTLAAGLLYDHPTVDRAARFLAGEAPAELPAPAPAVSAEPVAIIGLGCRFPEGQDPRAFWELLLQGRNVSREISADRWDVDAFYDPDPKAPGKMVTRRAALLDRVDLFDPAAFGISAREAARMDPQQRLALEVTHEALEDAGLPPSSLEGRRVGVFMGVANSDWSRMIFRNPETIDPWCGTGSASSIVANRLSYVLDWRGPSLAVDTACSSSLVAVHLAAQALRGGECELAVAGGVNVILSPEVSINFSKAGVMAPDGRCKSFDARADGYARGEGAGVVILKPLSRAIADGDAIYAVIQGSAVNSDGRTNGLMAPNGLAQEDAIRCALAQAGVSPDKVEYVETHGTGTLLGDPIEIGALGAVFGPGRSMDRPLLLGAAKTSISHLEAAAGIAGLIKTALVLHHREIPPNADFQSPNPRIPFDTLPLRVASERQAWPGTHERESFAGVSSFGFGGTNSHLIVAPAPATEPPPQESARAELLLLSARTPGSLRELALRYAEFPDGSSLRALCATAALRRDHHAHRLALVVHSIEELREQARAFAAESPARASTEALSSEKRKVVFVFPGQGSQWWAMGRELMASEPLFRANLEAWDALLRPLAGWSLIEELGRDELSSRVHETFLTQPALVALQVALARLLESLGLRPDAVVGHSMGEVAAACVAGKLSDRDAARVIFSRGQAMQSIAGGGAMAAVELPLDAMEREILPFAGRLSVAANNGPSACTVAGEPAAIEDLVTSLSERGIFCRKLMVTLAGHSPLMDPILEPFARAIGELSTAPARIPIYSTLLGRRADELAFDAAYWARNVREPVRFHDCVRALSEGGHRIFVEISPHPTLLTSIRQSSQALGTELLVVSPLRRKEPDRECLLGALGTLHTLGVPLDFRAIFPGNLQAVHLPATPWDRQAHWFVPPQEPARSRPHPLLDRSTRSPARRDSQDWEVELQGDEPAWLGHHRVGGHVVFPATGYLEMVRAASALSSNGESIDLVETRFERALVLAESTPRRVHLTLDRDPTTRSASFEVHSQAGEDGPWTLHVRGRVERASNAESSGIGEPIAAIQARCVPLSAREHYAAFDARAIQYGPAFQGVQEVWRRDGEALGRVILPSEAGSDQARHHLHPALLDACLQLIGDALPTRGPDRELTFMPVGVERLRLLGPARSICWSHAVLRPSKVGYLADVRVLDQAGQLVVEVLGFAVGRLDRAAGAAHTRDWFFDLSWTPLAEGAPETQLEGSLLAVAEGSPGSLALTEALGATGCWTLAPDRAALDAMMREMASFPEPRRVIFVAGASALDPDRDTPAVIEAEVLRLCGGLLSLCQAIVFRDLRAQLTVLTQGAQAVRSHERPDLVQAPLWGMGRCLAHELPELFRGLVDIEGERDLAPARAEILRPLHEDQLAFRDGHALGARLMPRAAPFQERALRCDPEATYLITGGRGALGTRLARWLAARGARHLLLTGRAPCPDPKRWATLAQEGDERARTWMELENTGVKVHLLQADVADERAMNHALEGLPQLRGVIHAAGVVHPSSFAEAGLELLAEELHPKVAGTLAVHGLARGRDLDFLVCFASAAGLWGSKFLVPYGAANHFQDAFAAWRRARGETALSVDWAMWGDAGMATGDANERLLRGMGLEPMSSEQALGALEGLMEEGASHVIVASVDWSLFKPLFEQQPHRSLLRAIRPAEPEAPTLAAEGSDVLTRLQATERFEGRLALVEEHLLRLLGGVLGVPNTRLKREASLLAQGLDSMTAAELRNRIQSTLGLPVNVLALLKGDSLVAVAAGLLKDIEARGLGKGTSAPTAVYPADEERLDPEIRPDPDRKASFDPQSPALLTGVTGFLGAFTLAELLRQGPAPVRCLVRAANQEEAARRVREVMEAAEIWEPAWEGRVITIATDLSKPRFGLDRARFEALAEEVGRVFHVGYLVNFLFSYDDMRATNIVGSNEILRLACTGTPKPVHFVSSFSVFLTREHTGKPIHEDSPLYPGPGGYRESKRACENLAREARARGLPVSIYRPPFISWHPKTGVYNERDFLIRLIEGCMALGAAPDVDLVFHLADVGYTSRALVGIAKDPEGLGGSYNLVPEPAGTSWRGLVALANEAGWPMELLPFARWRERLAEAGPGNPLYVFLPVLGEEITAGGATVFELFHRDYLPSRVDASNTTRHLPGDPGSPRPDAAQMRVFLGRLLARRG